jgi:hypothetical protein
MLGYFVFHTALLKMILFDIFQFRLSYNLYKRTEIWMEIYRERKNEY